MQRNGKSDVSIVHGKNHSRIRTIDADVSIARARVPSRRSIDTRSKLFLFLEYLSKIASVRDSRFNLDQLEETFRRRIVFESTIAIKVHPLDKPSKLSRHPAWNIQRSHSRLLPDWSFRASRSTLRAKIHDSPYNGTLLLLSPSRFFASRYRERERERETLSARFPFPIPRTSLRIRSEAYAIFLVGARMSSKLKFTRNAKIFGYATLDWVE